MKRTRIKICGIRDLDTMSAVVSAGADAVGFVFYESSPRHITPEDAWRLINDAPPFLTTVSLTVSATPDQFSDIEQLCPTDYSQLHGDESESTVRACGPRVIKAIRFNQSSVQRELKFWSAIEEVDAILVDGSAGGAGQSFDWAALTKAKHACAKPLILAGGLTPDNVEEAIRTVNPYAVDVSSGVETSPGAKDTALIERFCAAVRRADQSSYS